MSNRPSVENIKKSQTLRKVVSESILSKSQFESLANLKQGDFDWSGSFVKGATVPAQNCLFVASVFMETKDWCSGFRIYVLLRSCLHRSNLKTS